MSSMPPQEATSAPKNIGEFEVKGSKSGSQIRKQTTDSLAIERTSTASYRAPSSGKKQKPVVEPIHPPGGLLEYISSPVKYLTSVFSTPAIEIQKSPPKPKFKYPETPKMPEQKSPKPVEASPPPPPPPVKMPSPPAVEIPVEIIKPEQFEKTVDLVQNIVSKVKKPAEKPAANKKDVDPKRSSSLLAKTGSKTITFSNKNILADKKPSQRLHLPEISPRILSASSIKVAASNHLSYRVTSTEAEAAQAKQPKKPVKKVFKEWNKSPNNSNKSLSHSNKSPNSSKKSPNISRKRHASPSTVDKRDDNGWNYVPLNSVEFYRN